jgi:hypothetical protein
VALREFPKKIGNQRQRQACEAVLEKNAALLSDFASATTDEELSSAILKHRPDAARSMSDPRTVKERRELEGQEQERIAGRVSANGSGAKGSSSLTASK